MEFLQLNNPSYLELDDAYRSLPILGSIQVKSSNYALTIKDLEKIGFVAIEVISYLKEEESIAIQAFKGKHGPCRFTGFNASYTGAALAALDDDNHILFSNDPMEVCDKTYMIFSLPVYENLVKSESYLQDTVQSASKVEKEEPGDFDSRQAFLFDRLKGIKENSEARKSLFYPGPFRLLILQDGTMAHRGSWCNVPINLSAKLVQHDKFIDSIELHQGVLSYFQEEYEKQGSACLLNDFKPEIIEPPVYEADFSKLSTTGKELKTRLLDVIENQKKYFVLIGNDINDKIGCCPSQEVTEANQLAKHGILNDFAEPLQGESCPVTLYAFKDELTVTPEGLSCEINDEFRRAVYGKLTRSHQPRWTIVAKWLLLVFMVISLALATRKWQSLQFASVEYSLYEQLNPSKKDQFQVILFHNRKRCFQCLQMEKHTKDLISENYQDESETELIVFSTVIIDDPKSIDMVKKFGIFAPTLVLIEFNQKDMVRSKVLTNATGLYRDENAFKDHVKNKLQQFLVEDE